MTVAEVVGRRVFATLGVVGHAARRVRHPVTVLEEVLGEVLDEEFAEWAAVAVPLLVAVAASVSFGESDLLVFLVWAVGLGLLATRRAPRRTQDAERDIALAEARRAFLEGRIDEAEYDRRVEFLLDDLRREVREVAEEVNDVSPETSAALAMRFRSVEALERADCEDLEGVHGVGPSTAEAILRYLAEDWTDGSEENGDAAEVEVDVDAGGEALWSPDEGEDDFEDPSLAELYGDEEGEEDESGELADLSVDEIRDARELADEALDAESDVELEDLEAVPREALGDVE